MRMEYDYDCCVGEEEAEEEERKEEEEEEDDNVMKDWEMEKGKSFPFDDFIKREEKTRTRKEESAKPVIPSLDLDS